MEAVQLSFQINLILPNLNSAIFCSVLGIIHIYHYPLKSSRSVLAEKNILSAASPPPNGPLISKLGDTAVIAFTLFDPAVLEIVLPGLNLSSC